MSYAGVLQKVTINVYYEKAMQIFQKLFCTKIF